jgi:hypothetical protein
MLGSRADTGLIFDAIAGLNAEAVAVMAMHLRPGHVGSIDHVEQVLDTVLSMSAVAVATDDDHGASHRAIVSAAEGVGGLIAATSVAEGTGWLTDKSCLSKPQRLLSQGFQDSSSSSLSDGHDGGSILMKGSTLKALCCKPFRV